MEFQDLLEAMKGRPWPRSGGPSGGVEQTVQIMLHLAEAERRSLAAEVAALVRAHTRWWQEDTPRPKASESATAVAVAGTLTVARLPGALRRLSVDAPSRRARQAVVTGIVQVLQARGLIDDPRLAAELVRRVRDWDRWDSGRWYFELAREVLLRQPGPPPVEVAYVQLWLQDHRQVEADLRARPQWSALVMEALASRGTGQLLDGPDLRALLIRLTGDRPPGRPALLERSELLDACIGALQSTDRKVDLHGLLALHEQLNPSLDEVHSRVGQYVSLIAGAPAFVATVAQQRLRALDEVGRLDASVVEQATTAVLVRPEKGLFRAQLSWLRPALRRPGSVVPESVAPGAGVLESVVPGAGAPGAGAPGEGMPAFVVPESLILAVAVGLGHPDPALQKQVLNLLIPYATDLSAPARAELAVAVGAIAPDLRPLAAALTGGEHSPPALEAAPLPAPPPAVQPAQSLELFADAEILAEELAIFYQRWDSNGQVDFPQVERFLAGLVAFSWQDPERLQAALNPMMKRMTWLPEGPPQPQLPGRDEFVRYTSVLDLLVLCLRSVRALAAGPPELRRQPEVAPEELFHLENKHGVRAGDVILRRVAEVGAGILWSPVPVLLATPSTDEGVLEAAHLLSRLGLVEAAGCRPWPDDLRQAYLRVRPADRGPVLEAVRRVAGEQSASGLAALGSAGSRTSLQLWTRQTRYAVHYFDKNESRSDLLAVLHPTHSAELPQPWARLWRLPMPGAKMFFYDTAWLSCWPAILPFDREVTAAHLHRELAELNRGADEVVLAHARVPGPIGPAGLLLYCRALDSARAETRVAAAEALAVLLGRDELDSPALGHLLGRLAVERQVKLNRVVDALRGLGEAGAWPTVWAILASALPQCLPAPAGEPLARLADVVALAVEAAQHTQATGELLGHCPVDGLAEVAARKSASRLRTEARRLSGILAEANKGPADPAGLPGLAIGQV
ncbi:hypothetical protein Kisp01_16230 [Kineosporia sp. NBRC 101677]|uniref:hypothetical protein n=1 Tax=Kineosporia sp. NBRC 101677 TaxID=3032197 RepID=UPI0024A3E87A|nr:hypothetical protein [Kineosporia sp. NBRC 101677]GLY14608.1 hypothetical protein Kisp01_16230 [Kineosporia sp. NBRC 101677]